MISKRGSTGSVGIENHRGKLRLRLPTALKLPIRYISTGLDATPENFKKCQIKAWAIEEDITNGVLDCTLGKYKEKPKTYQFFSVSLISLWADYCEYRKPQVAATTYIKSYQGTFKKAIASLPTQDRRKALEVQKHLLATKSPYAAKRLLTQINACCKWAVKHKMLDSNEFSGLAGDIRVIPNDSEIDPFTSQEVQAIIKGFESHESYSHYTNFVRFLFLTGCRTGEVIALRWRHISPDYSQITFSESYNIQTKVAKGTKTGKARRFPCNPQLTALLSSLKPPDSKGDELLFTSLSGGMVNPEYFTGFIWRGTKKRPGIVSELVKEGKVSRYRPQYNTRHTFITMALEAGVSLPQIARWVGNSPEIILKHYGGVIATQVVPSMGLELIKQTRDSEVKEK